MTPVHRILACLWGLSLLLTPAPGRAEGADATESKTKIPRLKGIAPASGTQPANWGKQGLKIDVFAIERADATDFDRFGATALMGWTDSELCAQVKVQDRSPFEADDSALHDGDSVQLFLQGPDPKRGLVQLNVSPGRVPAHPVMRLQVLDYRNGSLEEKTPIAGRATVKENTGGYIVDVCLPFAAVFLAQPVNGAAIGARIVVTNGEQGKRTRLQQIADGASYEFANPPRMLLGDAASGAPILAVTAAYNERLDKLQIAVVAQPGAVGTPVEVRSGATVLGTLKLTRDGGRSMAKLVVPAPGVGETIEALEFRVRGKVVQALKLPNLKNERERLFRAVAEDRWAGRDRNLPWAAPHFSSRTFSGKAFPMIGYDDPKAIEALVGTVTLEVTYYDASFKPVALAALPGRYGAVINGRAPGNVTFTAYQTLFRRPDDGSFGVDDDAVLLAAGFESHKIGKVIDPVKADRDYWHGLRKRLNKAIAYESFVRTPTGYDREPHKKWPLIVYLHGSGGGDKMEDVQTSGPQEPARTRDGFPFIVLSLRSPGGWHPPAVADVIDSILPKYRVDLDRIYLTGFSMGGMGTWEVLFDNPQRFAAAAPVGGRRGHPELAARLAHLPIWVINGGADSATTPADAKLAVKALQAVGGNVRYTEFPNAGHVESHDIIYRGTELYDWFLKQVRPAAR